MTQSSSRIRRVTRRAVGAPCIAVDRQGFKLVGQNVIDVSEEGMRVRATHPVPQGRTLRVTFQVPTGGWLTVDAIVKRVEQGRRGGEQGYCLGLEYTRVDQREELRKKLRGIPPPIPTRALRATKRTPPPLAARAA